MPMVLAEMRKFRPRASWGFGIGFWFRGGEVLGCSFEVEGLLFLFGLLA